MSTSATITHNEAEGFAIAWTIVTEGAWGHEGNGEIEVRSPVPCSSVAAHLAGASIADLRSLAAGKVASVTV